MDKAQLITAVKEQLSKAETGQALNRLEAFLRDDPAYRKLHNLAIQAQARFQKAQRDEIQGLVSGEQTKLAYNQVNRQVLQLVEWFDEGNLQPEASFTEPNRPNRWPWIVCVVALILISAAGWYFWNQSRQP